MRVLLYDWMAIRPLISKMKNVLSLFDGMSCGRLALDRAGIKYNNYYASEIDKHTIQLGDVQNIKGIDLPKIGLLIGGSPCQGFSFAGNQLNFDDPRSKLFFEFVRLMKELEPTYFLLENVPMRKEYQDIISKHLSVEPIEINSELVSAQKRRRLYWTNIPNICLPQDKGILLKDILEDVKHPIIWKKWANYVPKDLPLFVDPYNKRAWKHNKSSALRTNVSNGNMWVKCKGGYRNLTRTECERLQTIPEGYTSSVSESQAKRMLGNGWTADIITHIFKGIIGGHN